MNEQERKDFAKELGRAGGKETLRKKGSDHFANMQKLSAEKRKKNREAKVSTGEGLPS